LYRLRNDGDRPHFSAAPRGRLGARGTGRLSPPSRILAGDGDLDLYRLCTTSPLGSPADQPACRREGCAGVSVLQSPRGPCIARPTPVSATTAARRFVDVTSEAGCVDVDALGVVAAEPTGRRRADDL
jgi:hypothetical protein